MSAVAQHSRDTQVVWDDLRDFVLVHGSGMFDRWPPAILTEWFAWHASRNQLVFDCDAHGDVCALFIGWRTSFSDLERHWHPGDPHGDCFFFSTLIVHPDHHDSIARIMARALELYPDAAKLRFFSRRAPSRRLQSYNLNALRRLARPKTA